MRGNGLLSLRARAAFRRMACVPPAIDTITDADACVPARGHALHPPSGKGGACNVTRVPRHTMCGRISLGAARRAVSSRPLRRQLNAPCDRRWWHAGSVLSHSAADGGVVARARSRRCASKSVRDTTCRRGPAPPGDEPHPFVLRTRARRAARKPAREPARRGAVQRGEPRWLEPCADGRQRVAAFAVVSNACAVSAALCGSVRVTRRAAVASPRRTLRLRCRTWRIRRPARRGTQTPSRALPSHARTRRRRRCIPNLAASTWPRWPPRSRCSRCAARTCSPRRLTAPRWRSSTSQPASPRHHLWRRSSRRRARAAASWSGRTPRCGSGWRGDGRGAARLRERRPPRLHPRSRRNTRLAAQLALPRRVALRAHRRGCLQPPTGPRLAAARRRRPNPPPPHPTATSGAVLMQLLRRALPPPPQRRSAAARALLQQASWREWQQPAAGRRRSPAATKRVPLSAARISRRGSQALPPLCARCLAAAVHGYGHTPRTKQRAAAFYPTAVGRASCNEADAAVAAAAPPPLPPAHAASHLAPPDEPADAEQRLSDGSEPPLGARRKRRRHCGTTAARSTPAAAPQLRRTRAGAASRRA